MMEALGRRFRLDNEIIGLVEQAMEMRVTDDPSQTDDALSVELSLGNRLFKRAVSRFVQRRARQQGLDVEAAIGDGTLLQLILENLDAIVAAILAVLDALGD